ncbi:hypothetical protein [Kutzneria kofuensis]|uniref:Uncharacterized protein n=1 Tax=Kutzneria kofuensis TaxID=103725 RepID=A0A7W9KP03_9PSEU|nr:hypothetical protein [Kutzneria kofuensis]MBB5896066.1 hypothetical protein [Kutzneria kofuensis]
MPENAVTAFVDSTLVRLSTPDGLRDLVFPSDDPAHTRIRALFAEVYRLPDAAVHDVSGVTVQSVTCQQPLFPQVQRIGNWMQTIPAHTRTDFTVEGNDHNSPQWMDLDARLTVDTVLTVDPGEVESWRIGDIGEFATLDEFRAKFSYFDLDAFLTEHRISTVEQLRDAFHYLRGEIRLKPAPPFDPADPRNGRRFPLRVAVLVRDIIDIAAALRDVRLVASACQRETGYQGDSDVAEATAACAPLLVFPASAVPATGLTQAQLTDFFTRQRAVAAFTT